MKGFLGLEVLVTNELEDYDEVSIVTRWDNEESFKNRTKSDAFKEVHAHNGGKPGYIISNEILYYDVKIIRKPIVPTLHNKLQYSINDFSYQTKVVLFLLLFTFSLYSIIER